MAIVIDSIDKKILGFLTENARTAFTDIAKACGVSGAAIHQRVNKLEESGVLKGSCCLVDEKILGYTTCAYIGVHFEKGGVYQSVLDRITGQYGLLLKIYAKDNSHLMNILSHQIQEIPGIASTETFISLEQSIQRQVAVL